MFFKNRYNSNLKFNFLNNFLLKHDFFNIDYLILFSKIYMAKYFSDT